MNKVVADLGVSPALWFWIQHNQAMDALYELDDAEGAGADESMLDHDLLLVWNDVEHRKKLLAVFEAAETDRDSLLASASQVLLDTFSQVGSYSRLEKRRGRDDWMAGFYLYPKRGQFKKNRKVWLSVALGEGDVTDQVLRTSLYSSGGQATTRLFISQFEGAEDRSIYPNEGWLSGSAVISRIKLSECLASGQDAIDLNSVMERFRSDMAKISNDAILRVLTALGI